MRNLKKSLSLILAIALIVSSVFVGGITASADLNLFTTTMTFDEEGYTFTNTGNSSYEATNISDGNSSGSLAAWRAYVANPNGTTDPDGPNLNNFEPFTVDIPDSHGNAVRFVKAAGFTGAYLPRVAVYQSESASLTDWQPTRGKTYQIKLRYYANATPSKPVVLSVRTKEYGWSGTTVAYNENRVLNEEVFKVTEATDSWQEATAYFTYTDENYVSKWDKLCLWLSTEKSSSGDASNVDVWVDDIVISECVSVTAHNYNNDDQNSSVYVTGTTTVAQVPVPQLENFYLNGIFADAEHTIRISASALAVDYMDSGLYYDWRELQDGEYFCGFENYTPVVTGSSYNKEVSTITTGDVYNGSYAMKTQLPENALTAIELRDKETFEIKAGIEYDISFSYKSTAAAKVFAGVGKTSDLVNSAYAIKGADLPAAAEWTNASITFTADKGTTEGFSPAVLLSSTTEAEILLDAIYLTYPAEETSALTGVTFSDATAWYPTLALFEGVIIEEEVSKDSPVWSASKTRTPAEDADGDGVYEIDSAEKLAHTVFTGGGGKSYILTKNIYLNDITKINWQDGTVAEGYTVRSWYTGASNNYTNFSGTIDGNGFSVYGLYHFQNKGSYSQYGKDYGAGLIPKTATGANTEVKNLFVDYAFVEYEAASSALIGVAKSHNTTDQTVTVKNCVVGENVKIIGGAAAAFVGNVGSLFSETAKLTVNIENCASWGTMAPNWSSHQGLATGHYQLLGTVLNVSNSYNATGPICGYVRSGKSTAYASNCYQTTASSSVITKGLTTVDSSVMKGAKAVSAFDQMAALNACGNYWVATDKYPMPSTFYGIDVVEVDIWNGTRVEPTEKDASGNILISTPEELAYAIYNGGIVTETQIQSTTTTDEETGEEIVTETEVQVTVPGKYILTNNIFLNSLNLVNWKTGEYANGYTINSWYSSSTSGYKAFEGSIDGNGYTVYGLYYNDGKDLSTVTSADHKGVGLIPRIPLQATTSFTKLGVDYMFINFKDNAGAFVGHVGKTSGGPEAAYYANVTFNQCYVGSKVNVTAYEAGHFIGRIVGANHSFYSCYSLATINNASYKFVQENVGLQGNNNWGGNLVAQENCYNAIGCLYNGGTWAELDAVSKNNYQGGICSNGNVWYGSRRTTDNMQGLDALTASAKMPNLNKDSATGETTTIYTATESYPILTVFNGKLYVEPVVEEEQPEEELPEEEEEEEVTTYEYWDGTSVAPTEGDGTEGNPWKIYTGAELYHVIANNGGEGVYYQLQNDIYLNDLSKVNWSTGSVASGYSQNAWVRNRSVQGHFDGNGYTVYGLYIHDGKTSYTGSPEATMGYGSGLFGHVLKDDVLTVKNLAIDNAYIRYEAGASAFVGYAAAGANVALENCYAGKAVTVVSGVAGGMIAVVGGDSAKATITVEKCYSIADMYSKHNKVAIVGYTHWTKIPYVTISNSYIVGGMVIGMNRSDTTITNCYETVNGPVDAGVTTITAENMTGEDVLTSTSKMSGLKNAYAFLAQEATFAQVNDFVVYLPVGTIFVESYDVSFFDTRMAPLSMEDVLYKGKMFRGAFVKFNELPDLENIQVPVSKAHRVTVGTAKDIFENHYFDIETEIISENLANQPDYAVNYLFITDTHFDSGDAVYTSEVKKQLQLIVDMANESDDIDFICLGGDLSNGGKTTAAGSITSLQGFLGPLKSCTKPTLILTGNHDDNAYSTDPSAFEYENGSKYSEEDALAAFKLKIVDADKWSDGIIDQFVNRVLPNGAEVKVVQNEDTVEDNNDADDDFNSKYYYYDLEAKKTRVICLNASDFPYAYDENGNFEPVLKNSSETLLRSKYYCGYNFWGYGDEQVKWLAEEALTAGDDWNYIFLSHMGIENNVKGTQSYVNGKEVRKIINAYQNKTTYENADKNIAQVDFSATEGKILSYQFGHEHYDAAVYNASSDLWQFLNTTINTSPDQADSEYQQVWSEKVGAVAVMSVTQGYVYKQTLGGFGETGMYYSSCKTVEGDVNLDTVVDIRDLVALRNSNNAKLPTAVMPTGDLAKMRDYILGK